MPRGIFETFPGQDLEWMFVGEANSRRELGGVPRAQWFDDRNVIQKIA